MIALVIIHNHRYDANIPRLDEIYKSRFSHIFHLVPFYDGNYVEVGRKTTNAKLKRNHCK